MSANTQTDELQQLIFIPGPGIGHIVAAVEAGKLIVTRDTRLSITYLLINDDEVRKYTHSNHHLHPRLRFVNLPELETPASSNSPMAATDHVDRHKPLVREAVLAITETKTPLAGIVIDMFCVNMIDVADEFQIPIYTFFTSSAGFLSLILFIQRLTDEEGLDITECDTDREFEIPCFVNRFPAKFLPSPMMDKNGASEVVMHTARQIRRTRGVFINTFEELERIVIQFLSDSKFPPIYPIGPLLNFENETENNDGGEIMRWLDLQPNSSVVFLCFGSKGSFSGTQIKHLACGLENSGHRFLWSLRGRNGADLSDLPNGFLQRVSGIGKVIGWAPQAAVLSHAAVGGFITHCGWNSILESLWEGVPMAAWPMYAEQQVNAFQVVVEMGLGVEMKMDYRDGGGDEVVVSAEAVERGVRRLMEDGGSGVREKVKDVREKSKRALMEGGSSNMYLGNLIRDILRNSPLCNC